MKTLLSRLLATATAGCALLLPLAAQAQTTVTFAGFGGTLQEAVVQGLFADANKLNIRIREERSGAWPGIKAHLVAKAPGWDMTEIGFARAEMAAQDNLIQAIDYTVVDKSKIPANLAQPKYVGVGTFSYGIAYQNKKYGRGKGPQTWAEFWDVQKFPGRRSIIGNGTYALEAALAADGVPLADIYKQLRTPAGVDRAFAKLEQIKPHVAVWWQSGGQAVQLMRDGEVDLIMIPNGRAMALADDGADISFVWNQAFVDTEAIIVPNTAGNPKAVMQLLNTALDPKNQAAFAKGSGFGPVNLKVFEQKLIDDKLMAWLPTAPQNIGKQLWADQKWYASPESEAAMQRFVKFLQK
ncbi:MAG: extracellular solute-binding protein [Burkholderiales bacterium]|nr:extracellular solute-binding protein [Burkholderiales bacterium]